MTEFQKNKWKYSTIGLLAVLAVGFSFPQASAHITNNTTHMLQHIYNFVDTLETSVGTLQTTANDIKAKTDTIPSDIASSANVTDAKTEILDAVSDIGTPSTPKTVNVDFDFTPNDGLTQQMSIVQASDGRTVSGHMEGFIFGDLSATNSLRMVCQVEGQLFNSLVLTSGGPVNRHFTCQDLKLAVLDFADGTDAGSVSVRLSLQYFESAEVTDTITN